MSLTNFWQDSTSSYLTSIPQNFKVIKISKKYILFLLSFYAAFDDVRELLSRLVSDDKTV